MGADLGDGDYTEEPAKGNTLPRTATGQETMMNAGTTDDSYFYFRIVVAQ
jgi:hypothetical protein